VIGVADALGRAHAEGVLCLGLPAGPARQPGRCPRGQAPTNWPAVRAVVRETLWPRGTPGRRWNCWTASARAAGDGSEVERRDSEVYATLQLASARPTHPYIMDRATINACSTRPRAPADRHRLAGRIRHGAQAFAARNRGALEAARAWSGPPGGRAARGGGQRQSRGNAHSARWSAKPGTGAADLTRLSGELGLVVAQHGRRRRAAEHLAMSEEGAAGQGARQAARRRARGQHPAQLEGEWPSPHSLPL